MIHIIITIAEKENECALVINGNMHNPTLAEKEMLFTLRDGKTVDLVNGIEEIVSKFKLSRPVKNAN